MGFNPHCFKEFLQLDQRNSKLCLVSMYGFGQENDSKTLLFHRFIDFVFEGEMHKNFYSCSKQHRKGLGFRHS